MPDFLKGTKLKFKLSSMFQTLPPLHKPIAVKFLKIREEGEKSLFEILLDNNTDTKPKDNDGVFYTPLPNTTSIDPKWDGL